MIAHSEVAPPSEQFDPLSFIEWRSKEVNVLSKSIINFESLESETGLEIYNPFDAIATEFILDPRSNLFLGQFQNFEDVSRAATLNILSTFGHKRNSGRPYASHPAVVANSIQRIATDISTPQLHESVMLSFLHDVIEEGPLRHALKGTVPVHSILYFQNEVDSVQLIAKSRKKLDYVFPENSTGRSVIELMEPIISAAQMELYSQMGFDLNTVEYGTFARMLQRSERSAVGNVEIADRIDDICDLDYIFKKNVAPDVKAKMLAGKLARCRHTVDSISNSKEVSLRLINGFNALYEFVFQQNSDVIDIDHFNKKLEGFYRFCDLNKNIIDDSLDNYLVKVIQ